MILLSSGRHFNPEQQLRLDDDCAMMAAQHCAESRRRDQEVNLRGRLRGRSRHVMRRPWPHFADRVDLDESFRSDSLLSPTSATICGQRTLWRAEVVRKSSSGTAFKGSMP
jgi:hypothetical protein